MNYELQEMINDWVYQITDKLEEIRKEIKELRQKP